MRCASHGPRCGRRGEWRGWHGGLLRRSWRWPCRCLPPRSTCFCGLGRRQQGRGGQGPLRRNRYLGGFRRRLFGRGCRGSGGRIDRGRAGRLRWHVRWCGPGQFGGSFARRRQRRSQDRRQGFRLEHHLHRRGLLLHKERRADSQDGQQPERQMQGKRGAGREGGVMPPVPASASLRRIPGQGRRLHLRPHGRTGDACSRWGC